MKYAVIAAGEGSRLAAEGVAEPKPLVRVGGERLIDRLIRVFMANGAEEIVVICNDLAGSVRAHLDEISRTGLDGAYVPLRVVVKTTPSSMHSFYEISRWLGGGPFVLTTVDTIFHEAEFSDYVAEFRRLAGQGEADGLMGVTDFIDDEKPLYVETDGALAISGFLDRSDTCRYISGGIYGLTPAVLGILSACVERGESRMRNFQRAMVAGGMRLKAYPFSKVLDIDHAGDILKAERFLTQHA